MAFVFRSDIRKEKEINKDSNLGPGQYLPLTKPKKIKKNQFAFLSTSPRKTEKKEFDIPGPGSYNPNKTSFKGKFNSKESYSNNGLNNTAIYKALEGTNMIDNLDPLQIWVNGQYEKLGFLTRSKRFDNKESKDKEDNVGPGSYIKIDPKKNNRETFQKLVKKEKMKTNNLHEVLNPAKIETIPAKKNLFGFDLSEKGNLIRNIDPDKNIKFAGDKKDSVGPGNYNLTNPDNWLRKGTLWSKSKSEKYYLKKDQNKLPNKKHKKILEEEEKSDLIFNNRVSKSFDQNQNSQNQNNQNYNTNFDDKFNNTSYDKKKFEVDIHTLKEKTKKMKEILFANHTNKLYDRSYLVKEKFTDESPGPGYYHDEKLFSGFIKSRKDESKQVFGSNCQRFTPFEPEDRGGPAYYYPEIPYINKIKMKEFREKFMGPQMAKIKKYKPIKIEEKIIPGPGSYSFQDIFEKKRMNCTENNFGSKSTRFKLCENDLNKKDVPGPGSYVGQNDWASKEKQNLAKIFRKPPTTAPIRSESINSNFVKKTKDIIPAVGTYNPDILTNMDYKVAKNCNKTTLVHAPFNLTKTRGRFEEFKKSNMLPNLGPGVYHKEPRKEKYEGRNPFGSGEMRFKEGQVKSEASPGQYNSLTTYDWNKKTYNILYV